MAGTLTLTWQVIRFWGNFFFPVRQRGSGELEDGGSVLVWVVVALLSVYRRIKGWPAPSGSLLLTTVGICAGEMKGKSKELQSSSHQLASTRCLFPLDDGWNGDRIFLEEVLLKKKKQPASTIGCLLVYLSFLKRISIVYMLINTNLEEWLISDATVSPWHQQWCFILSQYSSSFCLIFCILMEMSFFSLFLFNFFSMLLLKFGWNCVFGAFYVWFWINGTSLSCIVAPPCGW